MAHYMNPFHFVPLPPGGPIPLLPEALAGPRYEGYLTYTLKTLTELHITGQTTKQDRHFEYKEFYKNYGRFVIPGASIRGMLSSFIEAVTGSDLRSYTVGDGGVKWEKSTSQGEHTPYGKYYDPAASKKNRHVGFLMAACDDPLSIKAKTHDYLNGRGRNRLHYERNETLPPKFGQGLEPADAARFLFGHIPRADIEQASRAFRGRVFFEDLIIPEVVEMIPMPAWDLNENSVFGAPNPRANTAWYFKPGAYRARQAGRFDVWEVLADKVRGRKFYFHQDPNDCYEKYRSWRWMNLAEYHVQSLPREVKIKQGRIFFSDLPGPMLDLLIWALRLESKMAHKLGGLKPFGFGSVTLTVNEVWRRELNDPFGRLGLIPIPGQLTLYNIYPKAMDVLKKVMHFPAPEKRHDYVFIYPTCNMNREASREQKAFNTPEAADDGPGKEYLSRPPSYPNLVMQQKITMFFDQYQKSSSNWRAIME